MNPVTPTPVTPEAAIYAARSLRAHPDASEFGGYPGPTRFGHLGPRPVPDPRLPRYRAVFDPINEAAPPSGIEVGRLHPRGTGAVS